ncbi:MAG: AzlD domain-containing protein [Anaerolineae bacterium]
MREVLIVAGMALVTYATRYTMIAALGRKAALPGRPEGRSLLRAWLRYVPPAVLAALIVPPVVAPQGQVAVGVPLWATLVAAVIAWRTRNVFWTILVGMSVLWVLRGLGV